MADKAKTPKVAESELIARLPGDLRRIAEVAGLDAALKIANELGGVPLYIAKLDDLYREVRDAKIRAEYDGSGKTGKDLALKYNLTERQIWTILGREEETLPLFPLLPRQTF